MLADTEENHSWCSWSAAAHIPGKRYCSHVKLVDFYDFSSIVCFSDSSGSSSTIEFCCHIPKEKGFPVLVDSVEQLFSDILSGNNLFFKSVELYRRWNKKPFKNPLMCFSLHNVICCGKISAVCDCAYSNYMHTMTQSCDTILSLTT